ncbi:MAG TPA: DUF2934 domain-containing protein [Methylobacterium sp.]|jgi:hypothetical protein|uniref:DUF2934 domain-containing protein n=1 Tax=Methylorubrum sp. B1-46 TaxID=2897334 RepID=UPI001E50DEEF|nr:DUF2934 domain-containing protein [Methylorubrum sp. B1-46]UGB25233.1 DUF2934 domain-containing protein [Methylorubrum sp. B1-46]HEV2545403.1 DUF2934 domain-containing protein [Methylobacterium sp.]
MVLCENSVRERAYYIWEGEGRVFGRAEAHWLQAEAELRQSVTTVEAAVVAAPAKVAKPRASRAKVAETPAAALAGVAKAAKTKVAKAPAATVAKAAEKPAAKAVKAAPKAKPAASRAKSRAGAEAVVLH